MSDPVGFLIALTQALSTLGLYGTAHPASLRAADAAYRRLDDLYRARPGLAFTFLPGEVLLGQDLLSDLERWEWSGRFARAGIERLEVTAPVGEDHFRRFLCRAASILGISTEPENDLWQDGPEGLRFGRVQVADAGGEATRGESVAPPLTPAIAVSLREESDAVAWVHAEIQAGRPIPVLEAYTVVQSLSLAMHGGHGMVVPLLQLKEFDQYTTTHSLNVSVLTMALAEFMELPRPAVRAFGVAGLLHDLGKVRIPREILSKAGKLTPEERLVIEQHPSDGARILLEGSEPLDVAAAVAYEHHRCHDGSGYPRLHYAREAQQVSRLVHICDVYDALRTRRPYRDAWSSAQTLEYIRGRSGSEFDPAVTVPFLDMMRQWDGRLELHPAS